LKNRFGSRNYAAEELIAELGAAFLCAEFGFDGDVRNAGYIASWIELLKADKRAFFTACSQASKAADYLRGLALAQPGGKGGVMVPPAPTSNPRQREPFYDINPLTGASFEVFYSDRTMETFGRRGSGWFWWSRRRGCSPVALPTGPFATSYAAYRHALGAALGTASGRVHISQIKSG
jgi:hypothetical protein